jgi:hypothetical protein
MEPKNDRRNRLKSRQLLSQMLCDYCASVGIKGPTIMILQMKSAMLLTLVLMYAYAKKLHNF